MIRLMRSLSFFPFCDVLSIYLEMCPGDLNVIWRVFENQSRAHETAIQTLIHIIIHSMASTIACQLLIKIMIHDHFKTVFIENDPKSHQWDVVTINCIFHKITMKFILIFIIRIINRVRTVRHGCIAQYKLQ